MNQGRERTEQHEKESSDIESLTGLNWNEMGFEWKGGHG